MILKKVNHIKNGPRRFHKNKSKDLNLALKRISNQGIPLLLGTQRHSRSFLMPSGGRLMIVHLLNWMFDVEMGFVEVLGALVVSSLGWLLRCLFIHSVVSLLDHW